MEPNFCAVWFLILLKVAIFPFATKAQNSSLLSSNLDANGEKSAISRPELGEQVKNVQVSPINIGDHIIFPGNTKKIFKDSKKRHAVGGHTFDTYGVLAHEWKVIPVGTKSRIKKSSTKDGGSRRIKSRAEIKDKIRKRSKLNHRSYLRDTALNEDPMQSTRMVAQVVKKRAHDASNIRGTETFLADFPDSWKSASFNDRDSDQVQLQPMDSSDDVASCASREGGTESYLKCADMHRRAVMEADAQVDALKKKLWEIAAENDGGSASGDYSTHSGTSGRISRAWIQQRRINGAEKKVRSTSWTSEGGSVGRGNKARL